MRNINYLLLFVILLSSCNFTGGRRVRGNGTMSSQARSVGSFSRISVLSGMDVILNPGSGYAVKVEGDENLLRYILTEQDGNALVIKTRNGYNLSPRTGMKVYVTAPLIEEIQITGSGSVTSAAKLAATNKLQIHVSGSGDVRLDVDAPEVAAETTGSGSIILAGTTRNFDAAISGSGETKCFGLLSETTNVKITGSGSAEVFASKQLDINISGSGDVAYKGTPVIHQRIAGSGDVRSVP